MIRKAARLVLLLAWTVIAVHGPAWAQQAQESPAGLILQKARTFANNGEYSEALGELEAVFSSERSDISPADLVILRLEAAVIEVNAGKPEKAKQHLERAEQSLSGPAFRSEPVLVARLQHRLATVWDNMGDLRRAEALLTLSLITLTSDARSMSIASDAMNELGTIHLELLQIDAAIQNFKKSLELRAAATSNAAKAASEPAAARILTNLAMAYAENNNPANAHAAVTRAREAAGNDKALRAMADLAEAQALLRGLKVAEAEELLNRIAAEAGIDQELRGHALSSLARSQFDRGRMSEAVVSASGAIEAYRAAHQERRPAFARAQHTLGTALTSLGEDDRARGAFYSAAAVWSDLEDSGTKSMPYQMTQLEVAFLDVRKRDYSKAQQTGEAARDAFRNGRLPDKRPEGLAAVLLGVVAEGREQNEEAVALFREGQAGIESARGPLSPDLGFSLVRLGRLLTRMGRYAEAGPPLDRAIDIYQNVGGFETVRLSEAITARAELRVREGDRARAIKDAMDAKQLLRDRVGASAATRDMGTSGLRRNAHDLFLAQARVMLAVASGDPTLIEQAFAASQEALSSRAGEALKQTADRLALQGDDLSVRLRARDAALNDVEAANFAVLKWSTQRGMGTVSDISDPNRRNPHDWRKRALEQLNKIDVEISARHPKFDKSFRPDPATSADVQRTLAPDEALVMPETSDDGMLIWVVTRDDLRALSNPLRQADVAELVSRVRKGVDIDRVYGDSKRLDPFDFPASRMLFDLTVGAAQDAGLLKGISHLVFVPDYSLQSLPPHLLIDAQHHWLADSFSTTVSPSVSAAVATHGDASNRSRAKQAFLGIGGILPVTVVPRGPSAELWQRLKDLKRLTDSAQEVKDLEESYGAVNSKLLVGSDATLSQIKAAPLKSFRIIDFATHALMAGDFRGLPQPSIVLTPEGQSELPLLSMSEAATLELDADLVILSGCNTASSKGGAESEGLSGLAQSFIYAGARSLLVSHWSVDSKATARLMKVLAAADGRSGGSRRWAEALQKAMKSMIKENNPFYWAPFVVVGG